MKQQICGLALEGLNVRFLGADDRLDRLFPDLLSNAINALCKERCNVRTFGRLRAAFCDDLFEV